MKINHKTASLILAAGRGTRMTGYEGNKTLLPLIPTESPYRGTQSILSHILKELPAENKAIVVNHRKEDIVNATRGSGLTYIEQPELNGTGGALIAALPFLVQGDDEYVIITMGDVPLVRSATYMKLLQKLEANSFAVLGFKPASRKKYGLLQLKKNRVAGIVEWEYWRHYPERELEKLQICNSGIYAARKKDLIHYISILSSKPHIVQKEIHGKATEIHEYFITDLVAYMHNDKLPVACVLGNEEEVMGVDDLQALLQVQQIYRSHGED